MIRSFFHKTYRKVAMLAALSLTGLAGCNKDFFDKQPLDAVSDATFWKTRDDAQLALVGTYNSGTGFAGENFLVPRSLLYLDLMGGNGSEKELIPDRMTDGTLDAAYWQPQAHWGNAYRKITTCNNFLDHIAAISMDETEKKMMIAEVRTLRAYQYFNLAFYFGGVPLIQKVLTVDEANSVTRSTQQQVYDFLETELKASYPDLPLTRSAALRGRVTAGAALGILGRLQMARKKWSDAAATYKRIIDGGSYSIDPNYRQLFWEAGESSPEVVFAVEYVQDKYSHVMTQYLYPEMYGGWHQFSPYNELVQTYECTDGKPVTESPLYNANSPYDNRDPRLDYTIMISDRTVFKGQTFVSRPNSNSPDRFTRYNWSGYCINKFMDPNFNGSLFNSGANFSIIRYAEVLLGYLESKMEAGDAIDQTLLNQTINAVRGRSSVNMPPLTAPVTTAVLRERIRRERRVEFAFEGLRYYDVLRWGIAATELNRQFTGMKLTNTPTTYTDYPVDAQGFLIYQRRSFVAGKNELWPIPQSERDINKNLSQNPGY